MSLSTLGLTEKSGRSARRRCTLSLWPRSPWEPLVVRPEKWASWGPSHPQGSSAGPLQERQRAPAAPGAAPLMERAARSPPARTASRPYIIHCQMEPRALAPGLSSPGTSLTAPRTSPRCIFMDAGCEPPPLTQCDPGAPSQGLHRSHTTSY